MNRTDIQKALSTAKTLTFDCYGTLVDWKGGLSQVFVELFGNAARARLDELFDLYVSVEAEIEGGAFTKYRDILAIVSERMAGRMGVALDPSRKDYMARALPDWPLFPDTNEALLKLKKRYRLGVLSNIDRDLFAGTSRSFDATLDFVVAAEDVGSYKPSLGHFHRMLRDHGAKESTIHVAQSLFHDGVPASQLGLPFVWINRYDQTNDDGVPVTVEVPDLISLVRLIEPE